MLIRCPLAGVIACVICMVFLASVTIAAECQQHDNFSNWLEHFRQEAISQGISQQTTVSALNGITYDPAIIARDRSQNVFQQSFEQFSGRMVSPDRLRKGANMLKRYGSILERIEDRYGVPGEVLVAIWGLESDYGVNQGKYSTLHNATTNGSGELGRRAGEPAEACAFASGLSKAIGVTKLNNSLEVRIGENIQEFETGWERCFGACLRGKLTGCRHGAICSASIAVLKRAVKSVVDVS